MRHPQDTNDRFLVIISKWKIIQIIKFIVHSDALRIEKSVYELNLIGCSNDIFYSLPSTSFQELTKSLITMQFTSIVRSVYSFTNGMHSLTASRQKNNIYYL